MTLAAADTGTARRDAWLDGVNPAVRILLAFVLAIPLLTTIDVVSAGVAVVLMVLCIPLTGIGFGATLRRMAPVLVLMPVAGLSMLLYAEPGGRVYASFWYATISDASIGFAVAVGVRVIALALPTVLLFSRVDPIELAAALAQIVRLPARLVLGVLAGTRTLGLFVDDWRAMRLARRARGVGDRNAVRRFFSMAFVLLVFAVRRGTRLATAMEARGFGAPVERTWARTSRLSRRDGVALVGALAIVAVAIAVAVAVGSFRVVWM